MKNLSNVANDDQTRLDPNDQVENNPQTAETNSSDPSADGKKKYKGAAMAGVGMMAGAIGAIGLMAFRSAPAIENPEHAGSGGASPVIPEPENLDEISIAHSPNDAMSFNEAFAAARAEVGANGVFEWRGGVYGTYYESEWANFSDEYKAQFNNHDWRSEITADPQYVASPEPAADEAAAEQNMFGNHEIHVDENGQEYIILTDAITGEDVRISPEDLNYAVIDEYGEFVGIISEETLAAIQQEQDPQLEPGQDTLCLIMDEDGNVVDVTYIADPALDGIDGLYDEPVIIDDDDSVIVLNSEDENPDYYLADDQDAVVIDDEGFDVTVNGDDNDPYVSDPIDYLADNDLPDYANDAPVDDFLA